jgi:hypothetical protein
LWISSVSVPPLVSGNIFFAAGNLHNFNPLSQREVREWFELIFYKAAPGLASPDGREQRGGRR